MNCCAVQPVEIEIYFDYQVKRKEMSNATWIEFVQNWGTLAHPKFARLMARWWETIGIGGG